MVETYDGVRVLIDPYNDTVGYTLPKELRADIVLLSHAHPGHNYTETIHGHPAIYQGPGLRECGWVKIRGINSFHDQLQGAQYGANTIFCWDMRAVKFCHLGDLGHLPDAATLKQIDSVDILFVPIGGKTTLDPERVEKLLGLINYKYAIPMKYKTKYNDLQPIALENFLKNKNNVIVPKPVNEFLLDRKTLAVKEKSIVAMEYVEPVEQK